MTTGANHGMSTAAGNEQEIESVSSAIEALEREASHLEELSASPGAANMAALLRALQADWRAAVEGDPPDPGRLELATAVVRTFGRVYPWVR